MKASIRVLSAAMAIFVALILAAPASAGSGGGVPDAQVRRAGGQQLGDNIINVDGAGQTVGDQRPRNYADGAVRWFYAYVYNDGVGSVPFVVGATEPAPTTLSSPFLVQYFTPSGVDITASVLTNSYVTPVVDPGARWAIRVKITVTSGTPHGSFVNLLVHFSSQPAPWLQDAVGIKMLRK